MKSFALLLALNALIPRFCLSAPIRLSPAWHADGEGEAAAFGTRAMTAGDVNGDGYDDLIVGAPAWKHQRGKVYLYLGSARGLASQPAWTAQGEAEGEMFGDRVGQAGDVNGDGFDDVFIADPNWKSGYGRCLVFYGSRRGLKSKASWSVSPSDQGEQFGDCTHPTGDLDGDGFDDLAVGAYGFDQTRGRILLYRGSKQGLQKTPAWEGKGEARHDWYGYGVGSAGDVNGDGLCDFLAGAKYNDEAGTDSGKVYLHLGTKDGLLGPPAWVWHGGSKNANAGVRVTGAGDINGDGFADVLVSAPGVDGKLGELNIFFGSAQGLKKIPDQTLHAPQAGVEFFGQGACPAGDLDGDGYDDVAVHGRSARGLGAVYIYRGSANGLETLPAWIIEGEAMADRFGWWVAPAGDLDGDGAPDLVISAESHASGRIYVVYGSQFRNSGRLSGAKGVSKRGQLHGYLWNKKPISKLKKP